MNTFQLKRQKEKKEELKRDLGGIDLVDLSWDVYYKKVNSPPFNVLLQHCVFLLFFLLIVNDMIQILKRQISVQVSTFRRA